MAVLINLVFFLIAILIGAWCIADAIHEFKRKRYFLFGMNAMIAIGCIIELVKRTLVW